MEQSISANAAEAMVSSAAATADADLQDSINYLFDEVDASPAERLHLDHGDTWNHLQIFRSLLCQRPPYPVLPDKVMSKIENVLDYASSHRLLTPITSITPAATIARSEGHAPLRVSVWRGDITTLSGVTAIVNAANSQLLGCFQPSHRCIDNVIHSVAGPRLRSECARLMASQKNAPEPVGAAKVTQGYCLPAKYVVHTVGPQLDPRRRQEPSLEQRAQLASCYRSCLDAAEQLPADEHGRLSIAFCCISTGLFAFPGRLAAKIAVEEVAHWISSHPESPITDIIFDVFLEEDQRAYVAALEDAKLVQSPLPELSLRTITADPNRFMDIAQKWLSDADYLIISAGAGLSAAAGLDYSSTALFSDQFPGFLDLGLRRLYDVIGYNGWPDALRKWGYYFTHMAMVRSWPKSPLYQALLSAAQRFEKNYFVRTSNADGLFVANGFPADHVSTPQGQYRYLQCYAKCRPTAVFDAQKYVDAALPFIDPKTQTLTDPALIPKCEFCGGELTLCVRGGGYFNETPFQAQEQEWEKFIDRIKNDAPGKKAVILELGVGLNTPGVLRWPNEDLVEEGGGRFLLIRAGIGPSGCVPWEIESENMGYGIEGGIDTVVNGLFGLPN